MSLHLSAIEESIAGLKREIAKLEAVAALIKHDMQGKIVVLESKPVFASEPAHAFASDSKTVFASDSKTVFASEPVLRKFASYDAWVQNGEHHKVGEPAVVWEDDSWAYRHRGFTHRKDGQAYHTNWKSYFEDGWCVHGRYRRLDGPAHMIIRNIGSCSYTQYEGDDCLGTI